MLAGCQGFFSLLERMSGIIKKAFALECAGFFKNICTLLAAASFSRILSIFQQECRLCISVFMTRYNIDRDLRLMMH